MGKNVNHTIQMEILQYSYWEHFKAEKDLSMILQLDHPRRIMMHQQNQKLTEDIRKLSMKG